MGFGEWFISDIFSFAGGSFGFIFIFCLGYYYLREKVPKFKEPKDLHGWKELCENDLRFFKELDDQNLSKKDNLKRKKEFEAVLEKVVNQRITLIGGKKEIDYKKLLDKYLFRNRYQLNVFNTIPSLTVEKEIPHYLLGNEAIVSHLNLPLTAKALLLLKKIPQDMPTWLLISYDEFLIDKKNLEEFKSEIPQCFSNKIIYYKENSNKLEGVPLNFRNFTFNSRKNIENSKIRLLKKLHTSWQAEIETIRRIKLKEIQRKNQLLVAASVFASPIPSIDVMSMTILNSLMIKEIKQTWNCDWSPEILDTVSKQIIKTAIAQGVVEWSGQTLLNLSKFHGPNWLIAGSMQAISAAYLTRVVSRSLADFMAISKGVSEIDLEFIKLNSDKIVDNAFKSEKINWKSLITEFKSPIMFKFS